MNHKNSTDINQLVVKLWDAAKQLRANSPLRLNEFSEPVLGLIFLKFADFKFKKAKKEIEDERKQGNLKRQRPITSEDYHRRGILYIPDPAQFSNLICLAEGTDMGKATTNAMKVIESENKEIAGILPKNYNLLDNFTIVNLLKNLNQIPDDIEGDAFGLIYEYFLGNFASADGSAGGEFFTPTSIVKLIVEVLEPYQGKIYDPACGSGGMFVQSLKFIKQHAKNGNKSQASRRISIYGQEKTDQTVRIAKMNLAIHGLPADIRQGNTYYEDLHDSKGKFDFAMANPPFNVDKIDKERIKDDPRFSYGLPRADNGNYIWIQIFLNALKADGRAGFVMANSASDAGHSEKDIRQKLIENDLIDVMISVGPNMFYNVTLPVTLWFIDKGKKKTDRKDKILFIDARNIYRQIDRAHREFTDDQIQQIAEIVRSYRCEEGTRQYKDEKGLCKVATIEEVRHAGYSLNPGRYVGVIESKQSDEDVEMAVKSLHAEFLRLTEAAYDFEKKIATNFKRLF